VNGWFGGRIEEARVEKWWIVTRETFMEESSTASQGS